MKLQYNASKSEILIIIDFLLGKLSSMQAGSKLGISHVQVINLSSSLFRQWVQNGMIEFNEAFCREYSIKGGELSELKANIKK